MPINVGTWNSNCITITTDSTVNTNLVLRRALWYKNDRKSKANDINEFLKRVIIDKTISIRYYYEY